MNATTGSAVASRAACRHHGVGVIGALDPFVLLRDRDSVLDHRWTSGMAVHGQRSRGRRVDASEQIVLDRLGGTGPTVDRARTRSSNG
ncbi:MAG: hypothetical protein R2705_11320 [Ilumatobacteraceae bacterium]